MNTKLTFLLSALVTGLLGTQALAQQDTNAGYTTGQAPRSTMDHAIQGERWGIKPQVGVLSFSTPAENNITRGAAGATLEYNAMQGNTSVPNMYLGGVTGVFYSRIGQQGADFSGSGGNGIGDPNAYVTQIPANVKLGYNLSPDFRISVHGGGNVIYQSVNNTLSLGSNSENNAWNVLPNAGADVEVGLGSAVGIVLRPDLTFATGTGGNNVFTGTAGLLVALK